MTIFDELSRLNDKVKELEKEVEELKKTVSSTNNRIYQVECDHDWIYSNSSDTMTTSPNVSTRFCKKCWKKEVIWDYDTQIYCNWM